VSIFYKYGKHVAEISGRNALASLFEARLAAHSTKDTNSNDPMLDCLFPENLIALAATWKSLAVGSVGFTHNKMGSWKLSWSQNQNLRPVLSALHETGGQPETNIV
jgi:hypothetical protein